MDEDIARTLQREEDEQDAKRYPLSSFFLFLCTRSTQDRLTHLAGAVVTSRKALHIGASVLACGYAYSHRSSHRAAEHLLTTLNISDVLMLFQRHELLRGDDRIRASAPGQLLALLHGLPQEAHLRQVLAPADVFYLHSLTDVVCWYVRCVLLSWCHTNNIV